MDIFISWFEGTGLGDSSCRFSSEGGSRLALRTAPSLATVGGTVAPRAGDLDAASRAAISEVEDRAAAELRPLGSNVLAEGERGLGVNLPILSFTDPTSGPTSDPVL